jgi:acetoin utilization deacetylase AcuC-like enzyme
MKRRQIVSLLGLGALGAGIVAVRNDRSAPKPASARRGTPVEVFYTPAYVGAAHAFETTRKAGWVAASLAASPIEGIAMRAHAPLRAADLERIHAAEYVEAVRTGMPRALAQSQGFQWDPGLWPMVLASNGGVLAAARAARAGGGIAGSLASGLHHARRAHGAGFCTFNGLALAAVDAAAAGARVLVIDLDAHCGGGTHSIVAGTPAIRQLDIAVDAFDHYAPTGANTLDLLRDPGAYLPTLDARLAELAGERFDLCLYNAGMDPHAGSAVGGLPGVDAALLEARERRVFDWCRARRLPTAFVLAGGYLGPGLGRAGLVALHRLTLEAAAAG